MINKKHLILYSRQIRHLTVLSSFVWNFDVKFSGYVGEEEL